MGSSYKHVFKTLPDNTLFWKLKDFLDEKGYRPVIDLPNVISGNNVEIFCQTYPRPEHMEYVKELTFKIEKLSKKVIKS